MRMWLILVLSSVIRLSSQSIDSVHAYSTDKIKLGMKYAELKPYAIGLPSVEPKTKWIELKSGYDKKYLSFPITEATVLYDRGGIKKIQMNFSKYADDTEIENILTMAFGKPSKTEGTGNMWRTLWIVGEYAIDLNGGEDVSKYYLYLMYRQDLNE